MCGTGRHRDQKGGRFKIMKPKFQIDWSVLVLVLLLILYMVYVYFSYREVMDEKPCVERQAIGGVLVIGERECQD